MLFDSSFKISNNADQVDSILLKHNIIYNELGLREREEFRRRVHEFVRNKRFHGGNGFNIDFEKKIAVASSAIQITFGHDDYLLPDFNTIVIYEDIYMNHNTGMMHKGETNPEGIVVVSWKHFTAGNENKEDRINLGLHEMAHAYFIQIIKYGNEDSRIRTFLDKFIFNSEVEILKLRSRQKHLFRDYAGENMFEFFAVAVEYFYEAPNEFKEQMPEIYKFMCLLLNQDPSNKLYSRFIYGDYFKSADIKVVSKIDEKVLFKLEEKPLSIKIAAYFRIFMLSLFIVMLVHQIFNIDLGIIYIAFLVIVFLFSYGYSKVSSNEFYITENHVFEKVRSDFSKELYRGIPFRNLIIFDFAEISKFSYIDGNKYYVNKFIINDFVVRDDLQNFLLSKRILSRNNNIYRSKFMFRRRR